MRRFLFFMANISTVNRTKTSKKTFNVAPLPPFRLVVEIFVSASPETTLLYKRSHVYPRAYPINKCTYTALPGIFSFF